MTTPPARSETIEVNLQPDREGWSIVSLVGELDFGNQAYVWSSLEGLVAAGRNHLIVDLSRVPFCDSTGLGLLVRLHRLTGGWTRLAAPERMLRRMLEITNLDQILPVYDSIPEAAEADPRPAGGATGG
jgi:anti-sigma B factor antagonist